MVSASGEENKLFNRKAFRFSANLQPVAATHLQPVANFLTPLPYINPFILKYIVIVLKNIRNFMPQLIKGYNTNSDPSTFLYKIMSTIITD
jgi:hypothetical protein